MLFTGLKTLLEHVRDEVKKFSWVSFVGPHDSQQHPKSRTTIRIPVPIYHPRDLAYGPFPAASGNSSNP
ncbi:UNVERIFIED_CONTAM: hypothetical protein PYX00_000706 [Menopon gallinae]|uniref:Uncharacterized protein n=1 Tax=Menopon gallinae TaxID=328185 RepID=A0AAW2IA97_9NEOP